MSSTADYAIDLALIPDLVAEDARIQTLLDGPVKWEAEVALVDRACARLRDLQPELTALDEFALYELVAAALAERNG